MNTSSPSSTFLDTQTAIKEIRIKLTELSRVDLTNLHIDQEWSLIPYVKDHIDFLVEQVSGVEDALRDCRPPVSPEDIAKMIEHNQGEQSQPPQIDQIDHG